MSAPCATCRSNDFHVRGKLSDLRRTIGKVSRYPDSLPCRDQAVKAKAAYDKARTEFEAHKATHEGAT